MKKLFHLLLVPVLHASVVTAATDAVSSPFVTWIAGSQEWRNCTFPVTLSSPDEHFISSHYSDDYNATEAQIIDVETGKPLTVRFHRAYGAGTESLNTTFYLATTKPDSDYAPSIDRIAEVSGFASCAAGNRTIAVRRTTGEVVSGPFNVNLASPFPDAALAANRVSSFAYTRKITPGLSKCGDFIINTRVTQEDSPEGMVRLRHEGRYCPEVEMAYKVEDFEFQVDLTASRAAELGAPWLSESFPVTAPKWVTIDAVNPELGRISDCGDNIASFTATWTGSTFPTESVIRTHQSCERTDIPVPISVPKTETLTFMSEMSDFVRNVEKAEDWSLQETKSSSSSLTCSVSLFWGAAAATLIIMA